MVVETNIRNKNNFKTINIFFQVVMCAYMQFQVTIQIVQEFRTHYFNKKKNMYIYKYINLFNVQCARACIQKAHHTFLEMKRFLIRTNAFNIRCMICFFFFLNNNDSIKLDF